MGAIDAPSQSTNQTRPAGRQAISQSSVVIIATPVDTILEALPQVLCNPPKNAIVIDTGSTKMAICQK